MRVFVAVDLPPEIKRQVVTVCAGLEGVRWVKQEQLHLTLRFIGEVNVAEFSALDAALEAIAFQSFSVQLAGVGQFPPKGKPRVLWVGMPHEEALMTLARDVEAAVIQAGFAPESKPFSPHITLARLKFPPSEVALASYFEAHSGFRSDAFRVSAFTLYSSNLLPSGAVYKKERVYSAG